MDEQLQQDLNNINVALNHDSLKLNRKEHLALQDAYERIDAKLNPEAKANEAGNKEK